MCDVTPCDMSHVATFLTFVQIDANLSLGHAADLRTFESSKDRPNREEEEDEEVEEEENKEYR